MKKIFLTAFLLVSLMVQQALADRPVQVLGLGIGSGRTVYHQPATDRVLSNDTTYELTSLYFVDSLKTLTIPAGTVIQGDSAAVLIIARGGQIFAEGTPECPIIFTSDDPIGSRDPGDWGGVILLGKAPTNQANPVIEGGIIPGTYGGGGIGLGDPNDNSGIFRYVRIEYPGYRFQINNEVNGLTCGGVGRGTEIDHVQVSYSFDDSFEWFGGTVDCNYLVAYGGTDDDFDTDFGYQGRLQFLFALRDPNFSDPTGQSNGWESDNEGTSTTTAPRTQPRFSNVTEVGPRRDDGVTIPAPLNWEYVAVIRRGSECSIYNSIIMGYEGGYSMRDVNTSDAAIAGDLQARNNSLQEDGVLNTLHSSSLTGGFDLVTWFNTSGWGNLGGSAINIHRLPSAIGLTNMATLTSPDPRPTGGSEPATAGTEFTNLNALAGGYFTPTTYRGAFDPSLSLDAQWTAKWTNYDPQNFNTEGFTISDLINGWNLVSVDRTPASFVGNVLYPGVLSLYSYSTTGGSYTNVTSSPLVNGPGYWARYLAATCVNVTGTSLSSVNTTSGGAGWVLLGTASSIADYPADVNVTGGTIISGPFAYNGTSYVTVTKLHPGVGYWVRVSGNVTITVTP